MIMQSTDLIASLSHAHPHLQARTPRYNLFQRKQPHGLIGGKRKLAYPRRLVRISAASSLNFKSGKLRNSQDVGIGFSGAGLLFPYYIGVVEALQQNGIMHTDTKVAGASAGSIIAVAASSGVNMTTVTKGCWEVFRDYHKWGTAGRMSHALKGVLHEVLPDDVHERCNNKAFVSVTRLVPPLGGELVSNFSCKSDVISALLTSCHIPLYFDSYFETYFRHGLYMDGCFGDLLPAPPGCTDVIKISALPASNAARIFTGQKWDIAPDKFDTLQALAFPKSMFQALVPASKTEFYSMIKNGRRDANKWAAGQNQ